MSTRFTFRSALFVAMLVSTPLAAQNINADRYWFDDDLANITTNTVPATPSYTLNSAIPTAAFSAGFHKISMQFRDDQNAWSTPVERYFSRSGMNMIAYRYWFDGAADDATTASVPSTPIVQLTTPIPTADLRVGEHLISMQFRNADGSWSAPTERYFSKTGASLTAWQYWFDDNVGALVETAAGPNTTINVSTDIDASALGFGGHNITWRMKDALGNWSVPVSQNFDVTVGIPELDGVECLLLFPNPANEEITLRIDAISAQQLSIAVEDLTGRTVIAPRAMSFLASGTCTVATERLAQGNYLLRVSNARGSQVLPFVKR